MRSWPLLVAALFACGGSKGAASAVLDGGIEHDGGARDAGAPADTAVDASTTTPKPGESDRRYGNNGELQIDNGDALAFDSDGNLFVAERSPGGFDLVRYDTHGQRDALFGSHATGLTAVKIVVAEDGSVFVAGPANREDPTQMVIVRFDPSGAWDKTFGADGALVRDAPSGIFVNGLMLRRDGNLLFFGYELRGADPNVGVMYQVTPRGQLDPAFTSPLRPSQIPQAAVGTPANEAYVAVSETSVAGTTIDLVRMDAHGSNAGYGQKSVVAAESYNLFIFINEMKLARDGSLFLFANGNYQAEVRHLSTDGAPDPSFGDAGIVDTAVRHSNSFAGAGIVNDDNTVLAAGGTAVNAAKQTSPPGAFVARYRPDGTLDPSFGSSGIAIEGLKTDVLFNVGLGRTRDGRVLLGALPNANSVSVYAYWL